jgi:hypothetical protein
MKIDKKDDKLLKETEKELEKIQKEDAPRKNLLDIGAK